MKILISGASGFLGSRLNEYLISRGHQVFTLVRRNEKSPGEIYWDPYHRNLNPASIEGFDVVIHLSGENVGNGLWTSGKKYRIFKSRIKSTRFLIKTISKLQHKPKLFICASGTGYYADHRDQWIDEDTAKGFGFFPDLCQKWESEAAKVEPLGIRRVSLRLGMVLSKNAGALRAMARPVKFGLGAVMARGQQYMSWIYLPDLLKLFGFVLESNTHGAINAVAPNPVTNKSFTRSLARALHRPLFFKVPELPLRIFVGEMAGELLLKSLRVKSKVLEESGFVFDYPDLGQALKNEYR